VLQAPARHSLPGRLATRYISCMLKITFIEPDGVPRVLDAPLGTTLMEAAVQNQVSGILALCGGACACATCHVYVGAAWLAKLDPIEEMEEGMLEAAWQRRDNSRLSCQIHLSAALDGLQVTVPAQQAE
jgi:ferredoxin, 2Fe-2S